MTFAGPEAALPAVLVLIFDNLLTSPLAIGLLKATRGGSARLGPTPVRTVAMASVNIAALPTGAMVFVTAQRYETYVLRSSTLVPVSHVASVATVSSLLAVYA